MPGCSRFVIALLLALVGLTTFAQERPVVTVGVVFDGREADGDLGLGLLPEIEAAARSLTRREFDVRFPADKQRVGVWTIESTRQHYQALLDDPEVDVVLALGVISSGLAVGGPASKPVIAPLTIDTVAQGLTPVPNASQQLSSGIPNVHYLAGPSEVIDELKTFRELIGGDHIAMVIDRQLLQSVVGLDSFIQDSRDATGSSIQVVAADDTADDVLDALPAGIDGVYITPLVGMPTTEFLDLIAALNARDLPTFSLTGHEDVRLGVFAGTRPEQDIPRSARRVALGLQRIILGEAPESLPILVDVETRLMMNLATAAEIGFRPSWDVLFEAINVGQEDLDRGPPLTLDDAVAAAVQFNQELLAAEREVNASEETTEFTRAFRRPQFSASLTGRQIDEDRAAGSFGSAPERTLTSSLDLEQVLFDDSVNADVFLADRDLEVVQFDRDLLRLDVALDAAVAFLDVLRARVLEQVERDNLVLTESNLRLAEQRREIGTSGPADVYRWTSELATDRAAVIEANNDANAARLALNQLMNRDQEELFDPQPPRIGELLLLDSLASLDQYVNDPTSFKQFRDFSVQEGLQNSLELQALDKQIEAQDRAIKAARRQYRLPDVFAVGSVSHEIDADGVGQPTFGGNIPGFPVADDTNWSVSLSASLPLWSGGALRADTRRNIEQRGQLLEERRNIAQQVELRIRLATLEAGSTYPAIELTEVAAEAARRNLELVTDSYSRGLTNVIQLLDAQTSAQEAQAAANNARYDFLIDLMEVQRATNSFDFFVSANEREAWFQRLRTFFANREDDVILPWR